MMMTKIKDICPILKSKKEEHEHDHSHLSSYQDSQKYALEQVINSLFNKFFKKVHNLSRISPGSR